MPVSPAPTDPVRPPDTARLEIARLQVEDGVPLATVYARVTEAGADVLDVDRVGVWLYADGRRALRCADLFERDKNAHSAGVILRVADFPFYFAALDRRKTLPAEDAVTDPRTTGLVDAYLDPLGITSMLDAPVRVNGEVVGVVCYEHTGPAREWSTEERDFAGSMADLVALKIRAAEMADAKAVLAAQAAELAAARQAEAVARLAAGVAHDFKNILTVAGGFAELISADPGSPPAVAAAAGQIAAAVDRGRALAADLMGFANPGPRAARVIRPAELAAAAAPLLQSVAGADHPLELTVRSAAGRVLMAADQFDRVLLNLVTNARDASPPGGPIELTVDVVEDRDPDGRPGRFVRVDVADRGAGIPADVLPRIFDPFFSTKPRGQGTGLGLAVVAQAVQAAGGFVRVDSAAGAGTAFRVFLPRVSSTG